MKIKQHIVVLKTDLGLVDEYVSLNITRTSFFRSKVISHVSIRAKNLVLAAKKSPSFILKMFSRNVADVWYYHFKGKLFAERNFNCRKFRGFGFSTAKSNSTKNF